MSTSSQASRSSRRCSGTSFLDPGGGWGRQVLLDFSEVMFIEGCGVDRLKRIAAENLQIINCPALIEDLFKGGGEP